MAAAAVVFVGAMDIQRITVGQDAARRATSECEKSRDKEACQRMLTGIRAVVASEEAVRVSIWQSFFSAAGLAGLGFTVWYARRTWVEAQRSANADSAALEETRNGLAEARADAIEQARRFEAQIATATKAAEAAVRQADISEDVASKRLRAYVYAEALNFVWSPEGRPLFRLTIRNAGLTPAVSIRIGAKSGFSKLTEIPNFSHPEGSAPEPVLGGSASVETTIYVFGYENIQQNQVTRDNVLYVFGLIHYADVFGKGYETPFGFFTIQPIPSGNGMSRLGNIPAPFSEKK